MSIKLTEYVDLTAGTVLASATVIVYTFVPTDRVCVFRDVGFHVTVNLLYAPLFIKTQRIYRIFASAKTSVLIPRFVSGPAQIMMTATLVSVQVTRLTCSTL